MDAMRFPTARTKDLVAEHVLDECVAYDLQRHEAHTLNATATAVWRMCDGHTPVEEMAGRLAHDHGIGEEEAAQFVVLALQDLAQARLLTDEAQSVLTRTSNRRELMQRLARAGIVLALPVVASISAPRPASAQSACLPPWSTCNPGDRCCPGEYLPFVCRQGYFDPEWRCRPDFG